MLDNEVRKKAWKERLDNRPLKNLIKPSWILGILVIIAGTWPQVPWYIPFLGACLVAYVGWVGLQIVGSEDREFNSQIEQMRLAVLKAEEAAGLAKASVQKAEEAANRASKAVSDVRSESSRLR